MEASVSFKMALWHQRYMLWLFLKKSLIQRLTFLYFAYPNILIKVRGHTPLWRQGSETRQIHTRAKVRAKVES